MNKNRIRGIKSFFTYQIHYLLSARNSQTLALNETEIPALEELTFYRDKMGKIMSEFSSNTFVL